MELVGAFRATSQLQQPITHQWLIALGVPIRLRITAAFNCEVTSQSEYGFSVSVTSLNEPESNITVFWAIFLEHVWKSSVVRYIFLVLNNICFASGSRLCLFEAQLFMSRTCSSVRNRKSNDRAAMQKLARHLMSIDWLNEPTYMWLLSKHLT